MKLVIIIWFFIGDNRYIYIYVCIYAYIYVEQIDLKQKDLVAVNKNFRILVKYI
jgi:hypothetical protein